MYKKWQIPFIAGLSVGSISTMMMIKFKFPSASIEIERPEVVETEIKKYGIPSPLSRELFREHYISSYNHCLRNPNWVLERLTKNNNPLKPDRKKCAFHEDTEIIEEFRTHASDFIGTGFDRGHLVPAADAEESQDAMNETFLMTNMSPQLPRFNRIYWAHFERFVRNLTNHFDEVFVVTGPLYLPKPEEDGKLFVKYQVIGNPPNIAVPTHFYKSRFSCLTSHSWCQR